MYLSSQLFFETSHKTAKFPEKMLPLQTKIIKNKAEWSCGGVFVLFFSVLSIA